MVDERKSEGKNYKEYFLLWFQIGEYSVTQDQTLPETLCPKECLGDSLENRQTVAQKVKW